MPSLEQANSACLSYLHGSRAEFVVLLCPLKAAFGISRKRLSFFILHSSFFTYPSRPSITMHPKAALLSVESGSMGWRSGFHSSFFILRSSSLPLRSGNDELLSHSQAILTYFLERVSFAFKEIEHLIYYCDSLVFA